MASHSSYRDLYFHLFGVLAQAVEQIKQGDILLAYECPVKAQLQAEESCLEFDILPDQ